MDPSDFESRLLRRAKVGSKAFSIFHGLHKQCRSVFVCKESQVTRWFKSFKESQKQTSPKCSYKPSKKNQKKTPQVPLEVFADACQIRMA